MDVKKHDEIMSFIMNKLEQEQLSLSDGMSIWHSMGLFIFSQLDPENKDISKIYSDIREYLEEVEKAKKV
jgi:hypothetical protein